MFSWVLCKIAYFSTDLQIHSSVVKSHKREEGVQTKSGSGSLLLCRRYQQVSADTDLPAAHLFSMCSDLTQSFPALPDSIDATTSALQPEECRENEIIRATFFTFDL